MKTKHSEKKNAEEATQLSLSLSPSHSHAWQPSRCLRVSCVAHCVANAAEGKWGAASTWSFFFVFLLLLLLLLPWAMNKPQREIPTRRRFSKHAHAHTRNMGKKQRQSKRNNNNNKNNSRLARTAHTRTQSTLLSNIEPNPTKNAENLLHTRTLQRSLSSTCALCSLSLSTCMIFLAAFLCVTTTKTTTARSTSRRTHSRSPPLLAQFCSFIARTFVSFLCLCCANTL